MLQKVEIEKPRADLPVNIDKAMAAIRAAKTAEEARPLEQDLERAEKLMEASGLYTEDQIRVVNETRMHASWKLGALLLRVDRAAGPGRGKKKERAVTSFSALLGKLELTKPRAVERQRIGSMPPEELDKALVAAHKAGERATLSMLLVRARPYWYQKKRKQKHRSIARLAKKQKRVGRIGPFPLIYADPPWLFKTHTPDKTHRMPDDHYDTMTDDEIVECDFGEGITMQKLAAKHCALFMWCTSSNLARAIRVMERWGFEYKTHAVWDKVTIGLGLIFRNQHELLLYGVQGKPPKPDIVPRSVYREKKTKHSVKPKYFRKLLERMYPAFDSDARVELWARGKIKGWTAWGYEAG